MFKRRQIPYQTLKNYNYSDQKENTTRVNRKQELFIHSSILFTNSFIQQILIEYLPCAKDNGMQI